MFIVDAHLDLAYNVFRGRDVTRPAADQPEIREEIATVGLPDLRAGHIGLICATLFAVPAHYNPAGYRDAEGARAGVLSQLEWYLAQEGAGRLRLIRRRDELPGRGAPAGDALPAILLMEGADPLRTPEDIAEWFAAGLRIVGLAWERTRFAGGTGYPGRLTPAGVEMARALDGAGIIHDTSHLSDESFWELLDLVTGPVMASHSNCRSLVPGDRQLSDEMIKALAERGAVIGLNFYDKFLLPEAVRERQRVTLADVVSHVQHICDLTGSWVYVGLGTDMDGGLGRDQIPVEIKTIADLHRVADALNAARFHDDAVRGIMGGNWMRFFHSHLASG